MFDAGLQGLLSNADEAIRLFRAFLQVLNDEGGSNKHLNVLLKDAKGDKAILTALARKCIGPIWELAENPIKIGVLDFDCPFRNFLSKYPGIKILPGAMEDPWPKGSKWSDTRPTRACKYKLFHSPKPLLFGEVFVQNVEYAGCRELIAYFAKITKMGFAEPFREIIAPGSRKSDSEFTEGPIEYFTLPNGLIEEEGSAKIGWHGVKRLAQDRYDVGCFYLIRVYE